MEMVAAGKKILLENMKLKAGERVLVVTDTVQEEFGEALFEAALQLDCEPMIMKMKPRDKSGQEPPQAVANAMEKADIVLLFTLESLSHTRAKKKANECGARVASSPGMTREVMLGGGMTADYESITIAARKLAERLQGSKEAIVRSKSGTNLRLDLRGRTWLTETGICGPGATVNLPSGEVYIAPRGAEGILVVDTTMKPLNRLHSPIKMVVEKGKVVSFAGEGSEELERIVEETGEEARNIAELAIGMNPAIKEFTGVTLQDEKVAGTLHVAIGDSSTIGGNVEADIHFDGIIAEEPELIVDGEKIELPSRE